MLDNCASSVAAKLVETVSLVGLCQPSSTELQTYPLGEKLCNIQSSLNPIGFPQNLVIIQKDIVVTH